MYFCLKQTKPGLFSHVLKAKLFYNKGQSVRMYGKIVLFDIS